MFLFANDSNRPFIHLNFAFRPILRYKIRESPTLDHLSIHPNFFRYRNFGQTYLLWHVANTELIMFAIVYFL